MRHLCGPPGPRWQLTLALLAAARPAQLRKQLGHQSLALGQLHARIAQHACQQVAHCVLGSILVLKKERKGACK